MLLKTVERYSMTSHNGEMTFRVHGVGEYPDEPFHNFGALKYVAQRS